MRLTMSHMLTVIVGLFVHCHRLLLGKTYISNNVWYVIRMQEYSIGTIIEVGQPGQKDRSQEEWT